MNPDHTPTSTSPTRSRRWGKPAALVATGVLAGAVLAGTMSASAATGTPTPAVSGSASSPSATAPRVVDESKSVRSDEHLLTGDTADKVRAAALKTYPGATVLRVESDSEGVYEAHLTLADGSRASVQVDAAFAVTGHGAGMGGAGGGPHGGPGGPGAGSGTTNG